MPQVDYSHPPFNETAETRRRPQSNNQRTRLDSIIEDITRPRQNRPRINRNDVFRSSLKAPRAISYGRNFVETHPFLFGIMVFIVILAIVSTLISGQNFPMNSAGGDSNYVNHSPSVRNIQEPATTATDIPIYTGWEEYTAGNEQNTEEREREAVTPPDETEIDSVNNVNTEVTPSVNKQQPAQLTEKQPRWMTDPPEVFMRTRYVR
ncbi:MAG: hypothetical protein IBX72_11420 [Nitrospirae bacterium]|nr:hypothetical protein [Nitrospirota bacterium]